jgi:Domain of unknown function (DUF4380)
LKLILLLLCTTMTLSHISLADMKKYTLESSEISVVITPDAGGRILLASRKNQSNFLKLGDAVENHQAIFVNENTDFMPYFGHEVWFGPQTAWWSMQTLVESRRKNNAAWPPDPFVTLADNQILSQSPQKILMKSPASPISGLTVEKTFALVADDPRQIDLLVKATNSRESDVAWDIWFNTRSFPQTRIYAPVDLSTQVRTTSWDSPETAPVNYEISQGFLSLKLENPPKGKQQLKGKVFFQPSEGWFAGFNKQQLLIVQFPLEPIANIHPEQGQLEFYMEYSPTNEKLGILEMEVHSAYKKLKPGEVMTARERWTLIDYSGDESVEAQRKFLKEQLRNLKEIF